MKLLIDSNLIVNSNPRTMRVLEDVLERRPTPLRPVVRSTTRQAQHAVRMMRDARKDRWPNLHINVAAMTKPECRLAATFMDSPRAMCRGELLQRHGTLVVHFGTVAYNNDGRL